MPEPAPSGWDCHVHVFGGAATAQPGHYSPQDHALSDIESLAATHGIGHLVLVQPSVYGSNNGLLLQALAQRPGTHRGVVVLAGDETDAQLDHWHALGVRGVRHNLVSPVGNGMANWPAWQQVWAQRMQARGWHVQWYAPAHALAQLAQWQQQSGLVFVLDHCGGMRLESRANPEHWYALEKLADGGAWIKLSAPYRLGLDAFEGWQRMDVARIQRLFGPRMVWGSDWPHTSLERNALPSYSELLSQAAEAVGATAHQRMLTEQAVELYG